MGPPVINNAGNKYPGHDQGELTFNLNAAAVGGGSRIKYSSAMNGETEGLRRLTNKEVSLSACVRERT